MSRYTCFSRHLRRLKLRQLTTHLTTCAALIALQPARCSASKSAGQQHELRTASWAPGLELLGLPLTTSYLPTAVVLGTFASLVCVLLSIWIQTIRRLDRERHDIGAQLYFEDPSRTARVPLPNVYSEPCKRLTVVVPAYNEEGRLAAALNEALNFLREKRQRDPSFTFEIIVVDDGSTDGTYGSAMTFTERLGVDTFRVLKLPHNKGKGAAVRAGVLAGRGELLLFADADGATQFSDFDRLRDRLEAIAKSEGRAQTAPFGTIADRHGLVVGSRAHLENTDIVAKRHWVRNVMMHGFHFLVMLVAGSHIRDTQCGFKLATRRTSRLLFSNVRLQRWCFDVELIYLANRFQIPVEEVSVNWSEIPGSKVRLWTAFSMATELALVKSAYMSGCWHARDEVAA